MSESLSLVILCCTILIFIPCMLLYVSLMFMMNKIEITPTSIRRKCFGKITKEIPYERIIECRSINANFNFQNEESRNEKIGMFCAWCYISDKKKEYTNIEQLRMNRKVICFKLTRKTKEIFMFHCPNVEIKNKLFENVDS
ncbi:MAG: hypothetical protein NC087_06465 [Anaeroplasma bactoclasticum]|nr:hypothetical protein [Anaeroplasma bactoclasticum]